MTVEIVNTGAELLLGRRLNTHQQWLCRRLSDLGHDVLRQVAVTDAAPAICDAVRESLGRADVVLVTGGLGPTSDDLTRESIAAMLGRPLREDPAVRQRIERIFERRNRSMPDRARVQALVPEGASVLPNLAGTAPGLALELNPNSFRAGGRPGLLIMLPGPPRELYPMFDASVVPLLEAGPTATPLFVCLTLRTTGVPESEVQERIGPRLADAVSSGLDLGYCARPGEVDVRLTARGPEAKAVVSRAAAVVRMEMAETVYSEAEEDLETVVIRLLTEQGRTLAVAESCTGGLICDRLTNVPGASRVLRGALVTYANRAKQQWLGVSGELLERHGAVSEPVARAMADGIRRVSDSDFGVAVTGIAGPEGGTPQKPVGTVYIALATADGVEAVRRLNGWDRLTFKQVTAQQALDLVRRRAVSRPRQ